MRTFDPASVGMEPCPKCRLNEDAFATYRWLVRYVGGYAAVVMGSTRIEARPEYLEIACPVCGYVLTHMETADAGRLAVTA